MNVFGVVPVESVDCSLQFRGHNSESASVAPARGRV